MGTRPPTSTVNFVTGQTVANFAVCGIGFDVTFDDLASIFTERTTHVILGPHRPIGLPPAQVLQPLAAESPSTSDPLDAGRSRAARVAEKLRQLRTQLAQQL